MASRSASAAIFGNVPPKETPGSFVCTSPVQLRLLSGTLILGSNVSICGGPPTRKSITTDLSWKTFRASFAWARDASRPGSDRPPRAMLPTRRSSRRLSLWQLRTRPSPKIESMTFPREQTPSVMSLTDGKDDTRTAAR